MALRPEYPGVAEMLGNSRPTAPVYCIYPHVYRASTERFLELFQGRVLYAVKSNDQPMVLDCLYRAGVRHFDCASFAEVRQVKRQFKDAKCYFMIPDRPRGAAQAAFEQFDTRHFMVDHVDGIGRLAEEIPLDQCVVFVRMAVHHEGASQDLSAKFGALPEDVPGLVAQLAARGAEPALAFNVGSGVRDPEAYVHGIDVARSVLNKLDVPIRLLDIGGGYPRNYPGFQAPPLEAFFARINKDLEDLSLPAGTEFMCEPGRALAAPGLSTVVEVLSRKDQRLFINDGMYGAFWDLRFGMQSGFPVRAFREGRQLDPCDSLFTVYGPTCDSTDVLPARVPLPADIMAGDYLEFGKMGAYSVSGRTSFNGHYSDQFVTINNDSSLPPQ